MSLSGELTDLTVGVSQYYNARYVSVTGRVHNAQSYQVHCQVNTTTALTSRSVKEDSTRLVLREHDGGRNRCGGVGKKNKKPTCLQIVLICRSTQRVEDKLSNDVVCMK